MLARRIALSFARLEMTARERELAFLIADLAGYTALTEAHGNVHAAHAVTRYAEIALDVLEPGARLLERVGDELLFVAESAPVIVRTAVRLQAAIESEPSFPLIRCGIHMGAVVEEGGRYFGTALNLTARVASHARGAEILCTARIADEAAAALTEVRFSPLGSTSFKNLVDPVALYEVVHAGRGAEPTAVDPVCRMQVRPEAAPARLPFEGETYFFCSFDCAKAFAARPERYTGR